MKICRFFALPFLLLLLTAALAPAADDIRSAPSCSLCKMSREKFAFSRALLMLRDGTAVGTCSVTCAAFELARRGEARVVSVLVADYRTKELIDARSAFWVMGGVRKGVMTNLPKWALFDGGRGEGLHRTVRRRAGDLREGAGGGPLGHERQQQVSAPEGVPQTMTPHRKETNP